MSPEEKEIAFLKSQIDYLREQVQEARDLKVMFTALVCGMSKGGLAVHVTKKAISAHEFSHLVRIDEPYLDAIAFYCKSHL